MNRVSWATVGLVVMLLVAGGGFAAAQAYPPAISAGVRAEQLLYPSGSVFGLQLGGLLGWRAPLGSAGAFVALSAEAELTGYLYQSPVFTDSEEVDLLVSLPSGVHRLEIEAGLSSSVLGILGVSPYLQPDCYRVGLRGGGELWTERELLDGLGDPAGEKRKDLVFTLEGELEGLAGYFLGWNLAGSGGLRLSNANRYLEEALPPQLEENSENAWWLQAEGGLGWSPQRRLEIQAGAFGRGDFYLRREALDSGGVPTGQALQVLSDGLNARVGWLLQERLHLVASGETSWRLSNDPGERRWIGRVGAGVEYSF